MLCPKCGMEYDDEFKFCPNCAQANPSLTEVPEESSQEDISDSEPDSIPISPQSITTKTKRTPKKKLSEVVKPLVPKAQTLTSMVRKKLTKKTILIGAGAILLLVAVIVTFVILLTPSYPDTFALGNKSEGPVEVSDLSLTLRFKGEKRSSYRIGGDAHSTKRGSITISLKLTTSDGSTVEKVVVPLVENGNIEITKGIYVKGRISKADFASLTYEKKLEASDLVSFDNIADGQTLTMGPFTVVGTTKQPCSISFGGQPVAIGPDNKFVQVVNVAEGANTFTFDLEDEDGDRCSCLIKVTGQLSPEQYKASCPAGPPFANLNKNPDSFKGTKVRYRGKVVQALESAGTTELRVDITNSGYGFWTDTIYVTMSGTTPAVTDSIVDVYGTVGGSYTYTSQANYKITLPLINAQYVDVVQ